MTFKLGDVVQHNDKTIGVYIGDCRIRYCLTRYHDNCKYDNDISMERWWKKI